MLSKEVELARESRKRNLYGVYHISQLSSADRELFQTGNDRAIFLENLAQARKQFNFEILAYCLIEPTKYHLILGLHGCDISKLMSSVNISYTRQVKSPAGLFRDRFKSEELNSPAEARQTIERLKNRSIGETKWNSFCKIDKLDGLTKSLGIHALTKSTLEYFYQTKETSPCLETEEEVQEKLYQLAAAEGLSLAKAVGDKELRNEWICLMRRNSTLTLRQIGQIFGGLSESAVSKILKENKEGKTNA